MQEVAPFLRSRVGHLLGRCAMSLLYVDRLNELYDRHAHLCGAHFAHSVLRELGITYDVFAETPEVVSQRNELSRGNPFITISNHPYGSIDGVILADYFGNHCLDYKIMVNQLLGHVKAMSSSFIPVTPIGAEHRSPTSESILGVRHAFMHLKAGGALGVFPAGAVSDFSLRSWCVRDREWQPSIIRFIAQAKVPILPVRFLDGNSLFYYLLGLVDWRVRLLRLPAEVFNKAAVPVRLSVAPLISVEQQQQYLATHTLEEFGVWLRGKVYGLTLR